jgi:hypothetical protein
MNFKVLVSLLFLNVRRPVVRCHVGVHRTQPADPFGSETHAQELENHEVGVGYNVPDRGTKNF